MYFSGPILPGPPGKLSSNVTIVNTDNFRLVASLFIGFINLPPPTPPPPSESTHSVAADSENNLVFVPVTNVGVKVFTDRRRSVDENP